MAGNDSFYLSQASDVCVWVASIGVPIDRVFEEFPRTPQIHQESPLSEETIMSIKLWSSYVTMLVFMLELTGLLRGLHCVRADLIPVEHSVVERTFVRGRVQIRMTEQRSLVDSSPTFVITHGMGGTRSGDRFHELAVAIEIAIPTANVILIDWTEDATKSQTFLRIPDPWEVAKSVDLVAEEAAEKLQEMGIVSAQTTFIGESFGNCVNARVAEHLGRRGKILAFNPPNAAGGYRMPDLRVCADLTWSFHTFSVFDTQDTIAHAGFLLETDAEATEHDQHVAGIRWLVNQVRSGNMLWLLMQHKTVVARDEEFDGIATVSGKLLSDDRPLRQRPHENSKNSRTRMPVVTTSL